MDPTGPMIVFGFTVVVTTLIVSSSPELRDWVLKIVQALRARTAESPEPPAFAVTDEAISTLLARVAAVEWAVKEAKAQAGAAEQRAMAAVDGVNTLGQRIREGKASDGPDAAQRAQAEEQLRLARAAHGVAKVAEEARSRAAKEQFDALRITYANGSAATPAGGFFDALDAMSSRRTRVVPLVGDGGGTGGSASDAKPHSDKPHSDEAF